MTQNTPDPADEWADHLSRLDGARREAVVAALRHSASTGWPASERGVELLVAYALGEITSRAYATGLLRSWGVISSTAGVTAEPVVPEPEVAVPAVHAIPEIRDVPPVPPAPIPEPAPRLSREQAVHAYVTGQIDVGEFLRIARA